MKTFTNPRLLAAAAVMALVSLCVFALVGGPEGIASLSLAALGIGYLVKDAELRRTHALPNGAATTQSATGIDLGLSSRSDFLAEGEVLVTAPTLTTGELGDTQTITYSLEHDDAVGFGTVATIPGFAVVAVQTGAGGAGAAGAIIRVRLPSSVKRYVRLKTVKAGASNASTKSATFELAH
jgi:hypothetical protein